ncbi:MAG: glycosyltransferase family 39 protein [Myxococcota bacterium]
MGAGQVWRAPAPVKTFHDYDEIIVKYPFVMRGEQWSYGLPVFELVPNTWSGIGPTEVYDAMHHNPYENLRSYKTTAPISFVVSSIIPAIFGPSLWTIRLGAWLQLVIAVCCISDIGRRVHSRTVGLYAAILFSVLPVCYQGMRIGIPALGNMTGVCLALWALVRAEDGKNWGWSVLAGALIALSARWGESVGDALTCLAALTGPVVAATLLSLWQLNSRSGWKHPIGLVLAGATGYAVLDKQWIQDHTEKYVMAEAGFEDGFPSAVQPTEELNAMSARYWEALSESLMQDHQAVLCIIGILPALWILRKYPKWLLVLASPVGAWFILNSATKAQDFYAAPMIPALTLLGGLAISTFSPNKVVSVLLLGWLSLGCLLYTHTDIPSVRQLACSSPTFALATRDEAYCTGNLPHRDVFQWFRQWRLPPGAQEIRRRNMANWLLKGPGRKVINELPKDSMIMLSAPPGDDGDVLAVLIPALRPDILVHRSTLGPPSRLDNKLMTHFQRFYAVSFHLPGTVFKYQLPNWIVVDEMIATTDWFRISLAASRTERMKSIE